MLSTATGSTHDRRVATLAARWAGLARLEDRSRALRDDEDDDDDRHDEAKDETAHDMALMRVGWGMMASATCSVKSTGCPADCDRLAS